MITASLILNIAVLIPVCLVLLTDHEKAKQSAGIFTPARGILLAMYITILLASALLLYFNEPKLVFGLLFMQVVYKVLTPFTVKTVKNPIVISNLFIAAFHLATLYVILSGNTVSWNN